MAQAPIHPDLVCRIVADIIEKETLSLYTNTHELLQQSIEVLRNNKNDLLPPEEHKLPIRRFSYPWTQAFPLGCTLTFTLRTKSAQSEGGKMRYTYVAEVNVSYASGGGDATSALARAALITRIAALGATIQTVCDAMPSIEELR